MARIQIDDLPLLQDLSDEELQGIFREGIFPAERLRQLAAAATLGVTLVSGSLATAGGKAAQAGGRVAHRAEPHERRRTQTQHHTQPSQYRRQAGRAAGRRWLAGRTRMGVTTTSRWEGFCKEHGVKFSHGFYYVGRTRSTSPPGVRRALRDLPVL